MKKSKLKIGLVGLGFMGATHLQAYRKIEEVELAAVCSSDPEKLKGDLSRVQGNLELETGTLDFGRAARYTGYASLIEDADVEAVDLCVPTHLHEALTIAALRAGKDVLVEKPMALTPTACRRMLDASTQTERVLMVAQVIRFWPEYRAAHRWAASGDLGPILSAHFERRCGSPSWGGWLRDSERSGGSVLDLLVHDFDFARYLLGPPSEVSARGEVHPHLGIDQIDASISFNGKPPALVSGGWLPPSYPFRMGFRIVCEKGALEFRSDGLPLTLYPPEGEPRLIEVPEEDGFETELRAFVKACLERATPPECPPFESAEAVRLARSADESRRLSGQAVSVSAP